MPGAGTPDLFDVLVHRMGDGDRAGEVADRFSDWYDTRAYGAPPPTAPTIALLSGVTVRSPTPPLVQAPITEGPSARPKPRAVQPPRPKVLESGK